MIKTGIKQMRQHLTEYLDKVEQGQEVIITRHNKPIAKLVPVVKKEARPLGSRAELRRLVSAKGSPLSQTVTENREERF